MKLLSLLLTLSFSYSALSQPLWTDQDFFDQRKAERAKAQALYLKEDLESEMAETPEKQQKTEQEVLYSLLAQLDSYHQSETPVKAPKDNLVVTQKEKFYIKLNR